MTDRRTRALLRDLSGRYRYDTSIPTSGGLFPVPNNGCASARPFATEGMLELPLSMPRDGSLRFLGYSPGEIAQRLGRSENSVHGLHHRGRRALQHALTQAGATPSTLAA